MKRQAERASLYRLLKKLRKEHSGSEICKILTDKGVATARGGPWKPNMIPQFLWNYEKSVERDVKNGVVAEPKARAARTVTLTRHSDDIVDIAETLLASNLSKEQKRKVLGALLK